MVAFFSRSEFVRSMLSYRMAELDCLDPSDKSFEISTGGASIRVTSIGCSDHYDLFGEPALIEVSPVTSAHDEAKFSEALDVLLDKLMAEPGKTSNFQFMPPTAVTAVAEKRFEKRGFAIEPLAEAYVDLHLSNDEILRRFRATFRHNIRKSENQLQIQIYDQNSPWENFSEFQAMHLLVAGRVTRPDESWKEMENAIRGGSAYAVVAFLAKRLVAVTFCWHDNRTALYGTGVYDRSLFKTLPISHLPMYISIQHAKNLGCSEFILGISSRPTFNEKEEAIAHFKRGFASHIREGFIARPSMTLIDVS